MVQVLRHFGGNPSSDVPRLSASQIGLDAGLEVPSPESLLSLTEQLDSSLCL